MSVTCYINFSYTLLILLHTQPYTYVLFIAILHTRVRSLLPITYLLLRVIRKPEDIFITKTAFVEAAGSYSIASPCTCSY